MSVSPWLKSPFTDLTAGLISHQWYGECADMEMKVLECFEAYGLDKGLKKCDLLIQDFRECSLRHKQMKRMVAMRNERHRQAWNGERSKEEKYAKGPAPDSY
ncbi:NADH dehydrogenase (ubiquinone) 15 kDa subunit [Leptinotarsa decemlineata]|uniref:NADH dehydrogenase (ubiquinone) 15 kDa subunit n=1 Tax=Leptinotarsa decemlineata TaxID=7539 RepID=UPI000C253B3E|nr:uncharacterized protein LOC111505983 [Leptinotarsa decemlineata]